MSKEALELPQPFLYPEGWLAKNLLKTPVFLYRLDLGKVFGNYILILSTIGRKTRKTQRTPVEYFYHQGKYYIVSGFGNQPDWYKNIQENPQVTIQNGYETIGAVARQPHTDEEWEAVELYLTYSPVGRLLMPDYFTAFQDADVLEEIKKLPVFTFDPTDEPCPTPLEADLVWAWPLILLVMAFDITFFWLLRRNKLKP